jgi:hypothetical protein
MYLIDLFGVDITSQLVKRYFIGTSKHWKGATVFWQIDTLGKVRTGKIMLYNPTTGKRLKQPFNHIFWAHKLLNQPHFELRQCLFAEHLLIDKTKPVAIVESEKTAIIASVYFPQFIWLATGSLNNLNAEKCSILKGRSIVLFPDLNGFEKWNSTAQELSHIAIFQVSDLLERNASEAERKQGLDLADYLVNFNPKDFYPAKIEEINLSKPKQTSVEGKAIYQNQGENNANFSTHSQEENWDLEISDLEIFFSSVKDPIEPIKMKPFPMAFTDISQFVGGHLEYVKANNGNRTYLPYLLRLSQLKQAITINSKRNEQEN